MKLRTDKNLQERLAQGVRRIVRPDLSKPCLEIPGRKKSNGGYPTFLVDGKEFRVARLLLEQREGPLGALVVRHVCDNSKCVEIDHLVSGTPQQNSQDRKDRKRDERAGMFVHHTTRTQVGVTREVIADLRASGMSWRELASTLGLSKSYVWDLFHMRRGPQSVRGGLTTAAAA